MKTAKCIALLALAESAFGDVYMQYPPGSNNRLDEGGGNRNNNNRLMDTQNNAKGGYGYGGNQGNRAPPVSYMAGSKISMAWTSQHSCGSENAECQMVIQYMCNDAAAPAVGSGVSAQAAGIGEGPLRDGTNDRNAPDPDAPNAARGLHEGTAYYQACNGRERNRGLYTADQNLGNANDATRTRQNPNGARSALECAEERDYYPYWAPSPWRDLMVMTNNLEMCNYYKAESQNVKARGYCTGGNTGNNNEANGQADCADNGGQWTVVPPFNIPPPECVAAPVQRDNHLGNGQNGNEVFANISVPKMAGNPGSLLASADNAANCVVRLRYNITTGDTRACGTMGPPPQKDTTLTTKAACEAAGKTWSAFFLDSENNAQVGTNGIPDGNPKVDLGYGGAGQTDSLLELAINTNQYGRTFQDRSHVFSIEQRPAQIGANTNIYNLNVKGKRGNIVQTYPATEYDFHPVALEVGSSDYVHIQWTGNDNTNNNGGNNGEGTNNEDRHNIVQLQDSSLDIPMTAAQSNMFDVQREWNMEPPGSIMSGVRDKAALTKQAALAKQTNCLPAGNVNGDQQRQNCEKLNAATATVNLGLMQFKPGTYKYMSSRNNNFSNRAQKAQLTTFTQASAPTQQPTHVTATPVPSGNSASAKMLVEWKPPGDGTAPRGIDGKEYWGMNAEANNVAAYNLEYSCDGGVSWTAATCPSAGTSCEVDTLPAGTPCAFRVNSGSMAGWSAPSEVALAQTIDSSSSASCRRQLIDEANGKMITGEGILAIVAAVIAALLILICVGWLYCCGGKEAFANRMKPPPPPPAKYDGAAPQY